jgi:hypothetical protein
MSTTISDYELQVPARFVALFRRSLIDEVEFDASWVKDEGADLAKFYDEVDDSDKPDERDSDTLEALLEGRLEDLSGASRHLSEDYNLLERISRHISPRQDVTIRESYATLHVALEATICRAVKDMVDATDVAPVRGGRVVHRSSAAIWAVEEIERLSTEADAEANGGDA